MTMTMTITTTTISAAFPPHPRIRFVKYELRGQGCAPWLAWSLSDPCVLFSVTCDGGVSGTSSVWSKMLFTWYQIVQPSFSSNNSSSSSSSNNNMRHGTIVIVDGCKLLITPSSLCLLPPPMSASCLTCHTSHVTRHTSHVTRHTSHVTRHTSHVTRHTSHVTPHTSLIAQVRSAARDAGHGHWRELQVADELQMHIFHLTTYCSSQMRRLHADHVRRWQPPRHSPRVSRGNLRCPVQLSTQAALLRPQPFCISLSGTIPISISNSTCSSHRRVVVWPLLHSGCQRGIRQESDAARRPLLTAAAPHS
jgi:hypothetical protein